MSSAGWWRRQWPWLLGAVVLAAGTIVWPHFDRQRANNFHRESAARTVPAGAWGRYAGAEWRLRGVTVQDRTMLPRDLQLPDNARVLLAELEIRPDLTETGESSVGRCALTLRDGRGRGWRASPEALVTYSRRAGFPLDCARPRGQPAGPEYVARLPFLLPDDVSLSELRLELLLLPLPPGSDELSAAYLDMSLPGGR